MPYIREIGKNKYRIEISLGKDPETGDYIRRSKVGNSKTELRAWARDMLTKRDMGIIYDSQNISVREYLLLWIKEYVKPELAPSTHDGYKMIVEKHLIPMLGNIKLNNLKPLHIKAYQNQKLENGRINGEGGLSTTTVLQHHRVLSRALKKAVEWELIYRNPAQSISAPPKNNPEIQPLSRRELKYIIDECNNTKMKRILIIAGYTGMRRGEILGLRWQDVNFINHSISIVRTMVRANNQLIFKGTKNDSSKRNIAISQTLVNMLKSIRKEQKEYKLKFGPDYKDNDLVFTHEDGECMKPDYISHNFKDLARGLDMGEYKFHDLRHTHATLLLQAGEHPKKVQERLGHSNISTTLDVYSHVTKNMQQELADKFEKIMR